MSRLDRGRINVPEMLIALGVQNVTERGKEVEFSCPFPGHSGQDAHPSNSMEKGTTRWHCHACHRSGDAVTFVALLEGISPWRARRFLVEKWGDELGDGVDVVAAVERIISQGEARVEPPRSQAVLDEVQEHVVPVNWFRVEQDQASPDALKYMLSRGLTAETLHAWDVRFDLVTQRPTLTVRDPDGEIVGFKARSWRAGDDPKYLVLGDRSGFTRYGFEPYAIGRNLYGIHLANWGDDMVLCEGELNAMALWQAGIKRAVALGHSNVTDEQLKLIRTYAESVTIYFDPDAAGMDGAEKAWRKLIDFMPVKIVRAFDDAMELPAEARRNVVEDAFSPLVRSLI